jgi:putative oxidoreductase
MATIATTYGQAKESEATGWTAWAQKFAPVAGLGGRAALSAIFLLSGAGKIADFNGTMQYMAAKGMPLVPFFLVAAIVLELAGGFAVLAGYKARIGALALIGFLIPATLIFHNFWAFEGMQQKIEMIMFLKNVAIAGGLLTVVAHGSGALSLDGRSAK